MTKLSGKLITQPVAAERPIHSPLGASSAERWGNCPGSVELLKLLAIHAESDEPDYRAEGIAMHEAAAHILETEAESWEVVGQKFHGVEIDVPMADAIEVYVAHCRRLMPEATAMWIEKGISSPVHELFYGTVDFSALTPLRLHVVDLKGGIGIIVDPEGNPQIMYYAFGIIDAHPELPDELEVELTIAQPRAPVEPRVRTWVTTVGAIRAWVRDFLVPAMDRVALDHTLTPGEWCRFCPAKLVCPMLAGLFRAAATLDPKIIPNMSDEALGLNWQYVQAVEFHLKAIKEEVFRRLNHGRQPLGTKLVYQKADRVWKEDAAALAEAQFGGEAWGEPKFKSPAQLEKLSPAAAAFVKQHAFTPKAGLTVAASGDRRAEVKVKPSSEVYAAFAASVAQLEQEE